MTAENDALVAYAKQNHDARDATSRFFQSLAQRLVSAKQDPNKVQAIADELNGNAQSINQSAK